jgi:CheY-like chemotaxis protein
MWNSMHVLIVDPDPDDIELFCEAVLKVNPEMGCLFAKNGQDGWETLQAQKEKPTLIFTEVDMPQMNGFKFIECVKQHQALSNIPIIVYTAASYYLVSKQFQPIKEKCLELGILHLRKPSTFDELVDAVAACLESHKPQNK